MPDQHSGEFPSGTLQHWMDMAVERHQAGDIRQAAAIYSRILEKKPDHTDALHLSGMAASHDGQFQKAVSQILEAIRISPDVALYHANLGVVYHEMASYHEAVQSYRKAIELQPDSADIFRNLGATYRIMGEMSQAMSCYQKAIELNPHDAEAYNLMGVIYGCLQRSTEAFACFDQSLAICPGYAVAESNRLFFMNYSDDTDPETVFQHHRKWGNRHRPETCTAPGAFLNDRHFGRRLRVGYLSPDFRIHSVAFFIHPVIFNHDRQQVEVFCYADVKNPDVVTQSIMKHADHWCDICRMSDDQIFYEIQNDRIDILVDLAGHTGRNRMKLFARKPAPIQVSYLGYPNTSGLDAMDYRLTDAIADPPGESDRYYTEKLVRLDGGFLSYQSPEATPDISAIPSLANGYITFGSFNNRTKIGSRSIRVWSELLKKIPGSRLLLKSSVRSDSETKHDLSEEFVRNGIEPSRIEVMEYLSYNDHLKQYHRVDIALDTFPYNGTTTTFEALWMGVPVITLTGSTHASRMGASILSRINFQEGIASTEAEYIQKTLALAGNIEFLKSLRMTLREKLQASSLMDQTGFTLKLETAYRRMWLIWCEQLIAEGLDQPDVMTVSIKEDISVCVPDSLDDLTTYSLQEQQDSFEQEITFLRSYLRPGMKVVDTGIDYGVYALKAAKVVGTSGKVWAAPFRQTAAFLARSIRLNQMNHVALISADGLDMEFKATRLDFPEAHAIFSMDEGINKHIFDTDIDFVRIDAAGQEDVFLKKGEAFFQSASPLVQYKIKHETFHPETAARFMDLGYQSYRLVPGMGVLVPVDPEERPDAFHLNLYCCKSGCAETLSRRGLLVLPESIAGSLPLIPPELWIDFLPGLSYGQSFLRSWHAYCLRSVNDPFWQIHQQALSAYAASRINSFSVPGRFQALKKGYDLVTGLLADHATVPRILSAIRMALDLGLRESAVRLLKILMSSYESSSEIDVEEPFLSVSARMEAVDPGDKAGRWVMYSILETHEICQSFSSYFTGKKNLPDLERMAQYSFFSPDMERRLMLIQQRPGTVQEKYETA